MTSAGATRPERRRRPATTWRSLVEGATDQLAAGPVVAVDDPAQEARWLAQQASGLDAAEIHLDLDGPASALAAGSFRRMLERRLAGEPLQYALGRWAFRQLDLYVDRRVLIPRPETEMLAERALAECDHLGAATVVDLGTGSGALALALAVERPRLHEIWATDVSEDALGVARANLAGAGGVAARVRLACGSWFRALPGDLRGRVDVVVTNPPYVAQDELADLPDQVRDWEPVEALVSGHDGLDAVREIVGEAPGWLARPGALLVEMAPHQTTRAARLAHASGFTSVSVWPDLAGRDRILCARC